MCRLSAIGVCNPCALGDAIGALLRLAFHDAFGGGRGGVGGPNGCVNLDNPINRGLAEVIGQMDAARAPFAGAISRADFWVLGATVAIHYATTPGNDTSAGLPPSPGTLDLAFAYGRVDEATCEDTNFLPEANFSWAQTTAMFSRATGLNVEHMVALFGAHAVGRAQFEVRVEPPWGHARILGSPATMHAHRRRPALASAARSHSRPVRPSFLFIKHTFMCAEHWL